MPASAEDALKGMLAEGVSPEDVLSALESSGFAVTPPEGDASYGAPAEEELPGAAGDLIEIEETSAEEPETEEDDGDYDDKRMDVAKAAMEKHGF